jgi:hypothetical protein
VRLCVIMEISASMLRNLVDGIISPINSAAALSRPFKASADCRHGGGGGKLSLFQPWMYM